MRMVALGVVPGGRVLYCSCCGGMRARRSNTTVCGDCVTWAARVMLELGRKALRRSFKLIGRDGDEC